MIRLVASVFIVTMFTHASGAFEASSQYTTYNLDKDCAVFGRSVGEGDWADYVCPGWRGYPIFLRYTDGREVAAYGYYTNRPGMKSFSAFNEASRTVEWRIVSSEGGTFPFAAIQRWFVQQGENEKRIEILVVSKVGHPGANGECVVAYVQASGNAPANEQARKIADERAENFKCGSEKPHVDKGLMSVVPVEDSR